jgi:hypothetical protein
VIAFCRATASVAALVRQALRLSYKLRDESVAS